MLDYFSPKIIARRARLKVRGFGLQKSFPEPARAGVYCS
jgi:hypothetical protein